MNTEQIVIWFQYDTLEYSRLFKIASARIKVIKLCPYKL